MMLGGLVIGNLLQDFISDDTADYEMRLWAWKHYGTAQRSIYTMFEITFAGSWPAYARPVLNHVSDWYAVFFIIYITLVVFAVMRVITAIFLKDTFDAANNDADMMVSERKHKIKSYVKKLEEIFYAADASGDGVISEQELGELLKNEEVVRYLEALDLEVHQGTALFHLLDDGDGEITYQEFIDGILRFKGPARSIDLIAMQMDCKQMHKDIRGLVLGLQENKILSNGTRTLVRKQGRTRTTDLGKLAAGIMCTPSERPNDSESKENHGKQTTAILPMSPERPASDGKFQADHCNLTADIMPTTLELPASDAEYQEGKTALWARPASDGEGDEFGV